MEMTTRETLSAVRSTLAAGDTENIEAEAEWIVSHFLGLDQAELHVSPDQPVAPAIAADIHDAADRRCEGEPLQYVLGDVEFCGCRIGVAPGVLIPRPETEWIVETVLETLPPDTRTILDVGTGSGAIAIAIAARLPSSRVTAIDVSGTALDHASRNIVANEVTSRIQLLRADLHTLPFRSSVFDLIISNPPYIRSADIQKLEPEIRDHEPLLALDGGPDGASSYHALALQTSRLLTDRGHVVVELPGHDPDPIVDLFSTHGFGKAGVLNDWAGKPRLLSTRKST